MNPTPEQAPTVVNVREAAFDIYIGRGAGRAGDPRCRVGSVLAIPHRIVSKAATRAQALVEYESLWRHRLAGPTRREWFDRLRMLTGKRLGCWCAPEPCHGDVLRRLWLVFVAQVPEASAEEA